MVLPAISALHGLVLASSHANGQDGPKLQGSQEPCSDINLLGAVDLDIYGAFQFCAIGILAAVRRHPARIGFLG